MIVWLTTADVIGRGPEGPSFLLYLAQGWKDLASGSSGWWWLVSNASTYERNPSVTGIGISAVCDLGGSWEQILIMHTHVPRPSDH